MAGSRLKLLLAARSGAVAPPPPNNTVLPSISGVAVQGQTLTLDFGDWTGEVYGFAPQWMRDGVDIVDATASTYLLTEADVAANISGRVTATGPGGSDTATSTAVGPVTASSPILPAVQSITIGRKTRIGYGQPDIGYTGDGYLGITAGNASLHWQFNSFNWLVPKKGTAGQPLGTSPNTYAAAPPTFNDTYSLTIAEYSDAGLTTPTGVTGVVNITMENTAADFTIMPNPAAAGCSPDVLTSRISQLGTYLSSATIMAGGDDLYGADGHWNPNSGNARNRPPATGWPLTGGLTIRSRNPDRSVNADGVPNNMHGFKIGAISLESTVSGNIYWPLVFEDVYFHVTVPWVEPVGILEGAISKYAGGGFGVSYRNCRIQVDDNPSGKVGGVILTSGAADGQEAFVENLTTVTGGKPIVLSNAPGLVSKGSIIKNVWSDDPQDDVIAIGLTNVNTGSPGVAGTHIEGVFNYGGDPASGTHPDFIQHLGVKDGVSQVQFGSIRRCMIMMGADRALQAYFFDDTVAGALLLDAVLENLAATTDRAQGIWCTRFGNPTVRFNTILKALTGEIGANPYISLTSGVGGTLTHNLTSLVSSFGTQSGTVENHHNVVLNPDLSTFLTALPYWIETDELMSPARSLRCLTPANLAVASGGVVHPDGQVAGMLFPLNDPGDNNGALNDGSAFNPGNSVWLAAHPPATMAP